MNQTPESNFLFINQINDNLKVVKLGWFMLAHKKVGNLTTLVFSEHACYSSLYLGFRIVLPHGMEIDQTKSDVTFPLSCFFYLFFLFIRLQCTPGLPTIPYL